MRKKKTDVGWQTLKFDVVELCVMCSEPCKICLEDRKLKLGEFYCRCFKARIELIEDEKSKN